MSINRGTGKEDMVGIYNGIVSHKKNEKMSFAATWVDLEIIILSEVRQRQLPYDNSNIQNLIKMIQITYS